MSMPIEAFMPCLGFVKACVTASEENAKGDCSTNPSSTGMAINSPKILTVGADYVTTFDITYSGTLFALIDNTVKWKVETWLENVGGSPDQNVRKQTLIPHTQTSALTTISDSVSFNYNELTAGDIYKLVFKVELKVKGVLIVCGFSEGKLFHVSEG